MYIKHLVTYLPKSDAEGLWNYLRSQDYIDEQGMVNSALREDALAQIASSYPDKAKEILDILQTRLNNSERYPGIFVFVPHFTLKDQRTALAATDVGVVDSDPGTEAAGFSETDFSVTGALVLAPAWPDGEGILVSQGSRLNMDFNGDGNTLIPDIDIPEKELKYIDNEPWRSKIANAYLDIMLQLFTKTPLEVATYQATSIRLSRVLTYRMTSAEYMRQWSGAVARKTEAAGRFDAMLAQKTDEFMKQISGPHLTLAGSIARGAAALRELFRDEKKVRSGITFKEFKAERLKRDRISDDSYRTELQMMESLGIVTVLDKPQMPYRYVLRSDIRDLSPPNRDKVLDEISRMPELNHREINFEDGREDVRRAINAVVAVYRIHEMNMRFYPPVEDSKTLYQVIPLELVPVSMQSRFVSMVTRLNAEHPQLRERIEVVTAHQDLIETVKRLTNDGQNIVMVAAPDRECLSKLPVFPERGRMRALLFEKVEGGEDSLRQVEAIFAALRALYRSDANALIALYGITSGEEFKGSAEDIVADLDNPALLAQKITFCLKPIPIEAQEMRDRIGNRIIDLIRDAA